MREPEIPLAPRDRRATDVVRASRRGCEPAPVRGSRVARGVRALIAVACAWLASCPESGPTTPTSSAGAARRIVCGNAAAAEFTCRLVGAERVAGLPAQADEWGSLDLRSHGFERVPRFAHYTTENVLVLAPDLVVTHEWQNPDTTALLRSRGIDVVVLRSATSWEDIRGTLLTLGERLAVTDAARATVDGLDARVAALTASAASRARVRAMVYANNGTGGSTAGANTTPDTMLRLAGLVNAAAEGGLVGHVTIDFERLLVLDPDFLVVASPATGEGGSATRHVIESTPGLERLKARKPGHVIVISPAWMSADSPPLVDAAEAVAGAVDRVLAAESATGPR